MRSQRLEVSIALAALILFSYVLYLCVRSAENPVAASGIALQTLAGFFASVQLWANSPADSLLGWCAEQIEKKRWGIAGLLDGRFWSLALALVWYLLAAKALEISGSWDLPPILDWPVEIAILLAFLIGAVILLLAMMMFTAARLSSGVKLPQGKALATFRARLRRADWPWLIVGVMFLLGGTLQVAVA
jgi:hypothetical protein